MPLALIPWRLAPPPAPGAIRQVADPVVLRGAAGAAGSASAGSRDEVPDKGRYHVVDTPEKLEEFLVQLRKAKRFALDTETTSLVYMEAEIVGISLSIETGKAA